MSYHKAHRDIRKGFNTGDYIKEDTKKRKILKRTILKKEFLNRVADKEDLHVEKLLRDILYNNIRKPVYCLCGRPVFFFLWMFRLFSCSEHQYSLFFIQMDRFRRIRRGHFVPKLLCGSIFFIKFDLPAAGMS